LRSQPLPPSVVSTHSAGEWATVHQPPNAIALSASQLPVEGHPGQDHFQRQAFSLPIGSIPHLDTDIKTLETLNDEIAQDVDAVKEETKALETKWKKTQHWVKKHLGWVISAGVVAVVASATLGNAVNIATTKAVAKKAVETTLTPATLQGSPVATLPKSTNLKPLYWVGGLLGESAVHERWKDGPFPGVLSNGLRWVGIAWNTVFAEKTGVHLPTHHS
jgi:hypothetical protein